MDRRLGFICVLALAATSAEAGPGSERKREPPEIRPPAPQEVPIPRPRVAPRAPESASTGASTPQRRDATDLGFEAEKEEEAWLKRRRTAPLKRQ